MKAGIYEVNLRNRLTSEYLMESKKFSFSGMRLEGGCERVSSQMNMEIL